MSSLILLIKYTLSFNDSMEFGRDKLQTGNILFRNYILNVKKVKKCHTKQKKIFTKLLESKGQSIIAKKNLQDVKLQQIGKC